MDDSATTTTTSALEQRLKVGVGSSTGKSMKSKKHSKLRGMVKGKKDGKGGPGVPSFLQPSGGAPSPMGAPMPASPLPMGGSYSPLGNVGTMTPPQGAGSIASAMSAPAGPASPLPMGGTAKPMANMMPAIANKPHKKGLGKIIKPHAPKMKKLKSMLAKSSKKAPVFKM